MNKKNILLGILVCLLALGLTFIADNGSTSSDGGDVSLPVTTWVYEMTRSEMAAEVAKDPSSGMTKSEAEQFLKAMGVPDKMEVVKVTFTADKWTLYEVDKDGTATVVDTGTYTVSGSTITLKDSSGDEDTVTIKGNKITMKDPDSGQNFALTKK